MKIKSTLLILICSILILTTSLSATPITNNNATQTTRNYVEQLDQFRNQVFTLATKTTFSTPESKATFNKDSELISTNLNAIRNSMSEYYQSLPTQSSERRDILLLFNAVTLMENALFEINQLNATDSNVEKMVILEEYFRFRLGAQDMLDLVRKLLQQ